MCRIETDVLLKSEGNIPIEIIRASYNWQEVLLNNLPFLITIVIVSVAAYVTYRSNRASVEAQNEIASKSRQEEHENKISEFRHHWLQEVRETCSELIQIIHECQYFTKIQNSYHEQAKNPDKEDNEIILENNIAAMKSSFNSLISKRSEFYKKEAKLKLLFKKDDKEVIKVFDLLQSVKSKIGSEEVNSLDDEVIQEITSELQTVLKTEWEVTKNRTWLKNT
jgi:hypothetical protein